MLITNKGKIMPSLISCILNARIMLTAYINVCGSYGKKKVNYNTL